MGPVSEQLDKGNLRNEDHVNGELPPVRLRSGDKPTNTQMSGVLLPLRSGVAERLTLVDKMAQTSSAMGFDFPGSSRKFLGRRVATNKSGKSLLPSLSSKSTKEAALIQENHGESPKINEPTTPKRERSNPNNHDEWMTTELFLSKAHSYLQENEDEDIDDFDPEEVPLDAKMRRMFPPPAPKWLEGREHWAPRGMVFLPPNGYHRVMNGMDSLMWAIWWIAREYPKNFVYLLVFIVAQGLTTFFIPTVMEELVKKLKRVGDGTMSLSDIDWVAEVCTWGLWMIARSTLSWMISWYTPVGGAYRPPTLSALMRHILHLPADKDVMFRRKDFVPLFDAVNQCEKAILAVIRLTQDASMLLGFVSALAQFSVFMILLQLGVYTIMTPCFLVTSTLIMWREMSVEKSLDNFFTSLDELFAHRLTIRTYQLHQYAKVSIASGAATLSKSFKHLKIIRLRQNLIMDVLTDFGGMSIMLLGGILVIDREIQVQEVITFYAFYSNMNKLVLSIAKMFTDLQLSSVHLQKMLRVLHQRAESFPEADMDVDGSIRMKEVFFCYMPPPVLDEVENPHEDESVKDARRSTRAMSLPRQVLVNVNFNIPAGAKVALVGRSGSGKTTLINLLIREFQANFGEVMIGGHNVNKLDMAKHVSYLCQSPEVFDMSIRDNIKLGNEGITEETIQRCARQACLTGLAENAWLLPEGLDTECGSGGGNLSGGQNMRVCLARCYARNAPIVILDEPMAAQDIQVRKRIVDTIRGLTHTVPGDIGEEDIERPTTVLVVTHNLTDLASFDQIMFLQKKEVADFGSYERLMQERGPLWQFIFRSSLISANSSGDPMLTVSGMKCLPAFSELPDSILAELCSLWVVRHVQPREVIVQQGGSNESIVMLASGAAAEYLNLQELVEHRLAVCVLGEAEAQNISKAGSGAQRWQKAKRSIKAVPAVRRASENQAPTAAATGEYGELFRDVRIGDFAGYEMLHRHVESVHTGEVRHYLTTMLATTKCEVLVLESKALAGFLERNPKVVNHIKDIEIRHEKLRRRVLQQIWQFSSVPDELLDRLASHMQLELPPPRSEFYNVSSSPPGFYAVLSDNVALTLPNEVSNMIAPGQYFGLERLMEMEEHSDKVVKRADSMSNSHMLWMQPSLYKTFNQLPQFRNPVETVCSMVAKCRDADNLCRTWICSTMGRPQVYLLADQTEAALFHEGDTLHNAQRHMPHAYILVHGRVTLTLQTLNRTVITQEVEPPYIFNVGGLLTCKSPPVSLITAVAKVRTLVLQVPEEHADLLATSRLAQSWETMLAPLRLKTQLGLEDADADTLAAYFALGTRGLQANASPEMFDADSDVPMALIIIRGAMKGGAHGGATMREGAVLLNEAGHKRLGNWPTLDSNQNMEVRVVGGASRVGMTLAGSETNSVIAEVDLRNIGGQVVLRSVALRANLDKEEAQRKKLVLLAVEAQTELYMLWRELGWERKYVDARSAWQHCVRRVLGKFAAWEALDRTGWEPSEHPESEGLMFRDMLYATLKKELDRIGKMFQKASVVKRQRILKLENIKAMWKERGMPQNVRRNPWMTDDLSEQFTESLMKEIRKCELEMTTITKALYRQVDDLAIITSSPKVVITGITRRATELKDVHGFKTQTYLQEQIQHLRTKASRVVEETNTKIQYLEKHLGIPKEHRWQTLDLLHFVEKDVLLAMKQVKVLEIAAKKPTGIELEKRAVTAMLEDELQEERTAHQRTRAQLDDALSGSGDMMARALEKQQKLMDEIEMLKMENRSSDQEHRDKFNKMVIEKDETMQAWQKDRDMHELELNENVKQLHAALKAQQWEQLMLRKKFVQLRAEAFGMRASADIQTLPGTETDQVLEAKTPEKQSDLWKGTAEMSSLLGIDNDLADSINLVIRNPSIVESNKKVVREGRLQYLHLAEHVKIRSILDAYDKTTEMMAAAGMPNEKNQMVQNLVRVNPMNPADIVNHFAKAQDGVRRKLCVQRIKYALKTLSTAHSVYSPEKMAEMMSLTAKSSMSNLALENEALKLENWITILEYDQKIRQFNDNLVEEMNQLEGAKRTVHKERMYLKRDKLQAFQQQLIDKWERPPNTSPPEHPKFFRKVKKSTEMLVQAVRRGVLGKTVKHEGDDEEGRDEENRESDSSISAVADIATEALAKARDRLEQPEASGGQ